MIEVVPIGVVRSPYSTPLDAPRQGELATRPSVVEIEERYADGLDGLAAGDLLLVVWWADRADRRVLARPGANGVFTMRTPNRPNPICVSEVRVLAREGPRGARLVVEKLDAVDGSPVLDLKSAHAEWDGYLPLPGVGGAD